MDFWVKKNFSKGLEVEEYMGVFGEEWGILGLVWLDFRVVGKVVGDVLRVIVGYMVESFEFECEVCV